MQPSYAISAYATCNALGMDSAECLARLYAGESGLRSSAYDAGVDSALGVLPDALPSLPRALAEYDTRPARMAALLFTQLGSAPAAALRRYGAERVAIVIASSTAGLEASERAFAEQRRSGRPPSGFTLERTHSFHALVDVLRALSGARGPGFVVSTACSSGNKALGSAQRLLDAGVADAVLTGGIDTLCQVTVRGFHSLGILSARPCRPFSAARDGTSLGEGGALLLVERNAEARVRLYGVGESCDAHHMTQPLPDGAGAVAAMQAALAHAGLAPSDVDHVNAHGTGTPQNDHSEAQAIAALLGSRVPVVSTKGYTGHVLGAAASIEAVFAIAAIERGELPASLGSDPLDPQLAIGVNARRCAARCRFVLSNALAFGGSNASALFGAVT